MERENEQWKDGKNSNQERQSVTVIPLCLSNILFKGTQEKYCNWLEELLDELLLRHRPQLESPALLTWAIGLTGLLFYFSSIKGWMVSGKYHIYISRHLQCFKKFKYLNISKLDSIMNTDFSVSITFTSNPNTSLLRRQYGTDAAWTLLELWTWGTINRASGIFTGMNEDQIEAAADWNGERGELIKALLAFEWLTKTQDSVYALHEWAETNPWAADADNRSDKARLSSMAKNYPELYEELIAQGFSGIDRATYASLPAEYNKRGILRSTSGLQRIVSSYAYSSSCPYPVSCS